MDEVELALDTLKTQLKQQEAEVAFTRGQIEYLENFPAVKQPPKQRKPRQSKPAEEISENRESTVVAA